MPWKKSGGARVFSRDARDVGVARIYRTRSVLMYLLRVIVDVRDIDN